MMLFVGQGDGHPCNPQRPLTFRLQGPEVIAAANARHSLVFNPAFPCGVERGATFSAGDDIPLRVLGRWAGCVGAEPQCPGDFVLVRGEVMARSALFSNDPPIKPPANFFECEDNVISTYPRIKLALWSCGWHGPVIIDADSQMVVPAGELRIDVLGPGPSLPTSSDFGIEPWVEGPLTMLDERQIVDVQLRVSACPLTSDYAPTGILSEYLHTVGNDGAVALADRILLRPRRARTLAIAPILPTGCAILLLLDTTGTLPFVGQFVFGTGAPAGGLFSLMEIFGAWPAFFVSNSAGGTQRLAIRWEIV